MLIAGEDFALVNRFGGLWGSTLAKFGLLQLTTTTGGTTQTHLKKEIGFVHERVRDEATVESASVDLFDHPAAEMRFARSDISKHQSESSPYAIMGQVKIDSLPEGSKHNMIPIELLSALGECRLKYS